MGSDLLLFFSNTINMHLYVNSSITTWLEMLNGETNAERNGGQHGFIYHNQQAVLGRMGLMNLLLHTGGEEDLGSPPAEKTNLMPIPAHLQETFQAAAAQYAREIVGSRTSSPTYPQQQQQEQKRGEFACTTRVNSSPTSSV